MGHEVWRENGGKTGKTVPLRLHLIYVAPSWKRARGLKSRLEKAARITFAGLPLALQKRGQGGEVNVLLTSDKEVQRLNNTFRKKNKPTNVLSFPNELPLKNRGESFPLGDLALAYAYTAKEARAEEKILLNHVTHLVIHGLLHLFGYDHMTSSAANRMEKLETRLMAELGLPDPYTMK